MVTFLTLLSCESSVSESENPNRIKKCLETSIFVQYQYHYISRFFWSKKFALISINFSKFLHFLCGTFVSYFNSNENLFLDKIYISTTLLLSFFSFSLSIIITNLRNLINLIMKTFSYSFHNVNFFSFYYHPIVIDFMCIL